MCKHRGWLFLCALLFVACSSSSESDSSQDAAAQRSNMTADAVETSTEHDGEAERVPEAEEDAVPQIDVSTSDSGGESGPNEDVADGDMGPEPTDPDPVISEASVLAVPCADTPEAVYVIPEWALQTDVERGDIVACSPEMGFSLAALSEQGEKLDVQPKTPVSVYRIAYRTERTGGLPGVGTALVFLPNPMPETPMPLLIATHGTTGLADFCAPSYYPGWMPDLAMPFASHGMAVIAPDYAGLGNEGSQGYGDSHDTGYSTLDSAGALRRLLPEGSLTEEVAVLGHSQGGGAALAAQGLANSYGLDGNLVGVVPFAPGWAYTAEVNRGAYAFPDYVNATLGLGVTAAAFALYLYAFIDNHVPDEEPGLFFSDAWRDTIVGWIESSCILTLATNFYELGMLITFADLFSADFYEGVLACIDQEESCTEPYASYLAYSKTTYIPVDPDGAAILFIQGLQDMVVTAASARCRVEVMEATGLTPTVCVDTMSDHMTVLDNKMAFAKTWLDALFQGESLPSCAGGSTLLPPCGF